ncbi:hypothetical protein ACFWJM_05955 [Streptomyces sp. NPDC127077]|uniref:hypothetical protein n=1 Tax=Streptomyces sp. NPDC127077 TaxID=3347131 RepID=UPI003648CB42
MTTEVYVEQFLLCALDASGGSLNEFLAPEAIMESAQLGAAEQDAVVSSLIAQRYVSSQGERADGSVDLIRLTANGLKQARHLRRISQSRAERDIYLHNALVRWAYEHTPPAGSVSLQEFAGNERWWFAGTQVTWDEVEAAVGFLEAERLLVVERTVGRIGVRPTPLGIRFAQSDMTLRTFMTTHQPQSPGVTNNFSDSIVVHGSVSGSALATAGNNTQSVTHGVDAHALASLITQLRQVAPTLQLPEDNVHDLSEEIDTLEREGDDLGRGRRIWRNIKLILTAAITSAAAAGSEQAVQAAITAGSQLFS